MRLGAGFGSAIAEIMPEIEPIDQPPFPRSPLDGYALRSADTEGASRETPVSLKVIDEVFAGGFCLSRVTEGCAVRIMTGAPIPEGADCIIMQEDTDYGMETVNIYRSLRHLQNYCFAGEDYKKGTLVMKPGMQLSAPEIGVIAGMGIGRLSVYRKLRALVMSTGSELVSPGQPLKPGQIYDSNLHMLLAQLRMWDIEITAGNLMDDDPEHACAFIRENADRADIIISTGGVSVGKKDIMHDVLDILGAEKLFWKVSLKPGMPTLCGLISGKPVHCSVRKSVWGYREPASSGQTGSCFHGEAVGSGNSNGDSRVRYRLPKKKSGD